MSSHLEILTIDDFDLTGKTVFVRADMNSAIDPKSGKLLDHSRISEAAITVRELSRSKVVVGSHQGRVGGYDYVSLHEHAKALGEYVGRKVKFVEDVIGRAAMEEIRSLRDGDVLLLDNLRLAAEENFEFTIEAASNTHLVRRLSSVVDYCVLDSFPTAHRAHPSIVGFAKVRPTLAGRLVVKEVKALRNVQQVMKAPFVTVLGGAKISDRLEAMEALIEGGKADKILMTGLIALVFLRAVGKIKRPINIKDEERLIEKAGSIYSKYYERIELPEDLAILSGDSRVELPVEGVEDPSLVRDIGTNTVRRYVKVIKSAGTVFASGPPGVFEDDRFSFGTNEILQAVASSLGVTIVSGGHLSTALQKLNIKDWIDYVSTAGGALVMYLAGKRLPMFEALKASSELWRSKVA
ncbi:MAG: phosphoglycerate kinase [Thaumarchaeota archaeon]|nr:phosphoglycerate kinase [Candidatus Calditenuaceae archaeon]MDW8187515.1 phosphoglycerate kinase [Nitrososphaerota archaeon]